LHSVILILLTANGPASFSKDTLRDDKAVILPRTRREVLAVPDFNTCPFCHTDIKPNSKQARSGGKKRLRQGESRMRSRWTQFLVTFGEK
jgi:hypothetical protein